MKLKLKNSSSASPSDIASLETRLGASLPQSYKVFVAAHDGAEPETNIFRVSDLNESGISKFIRVSETEQESGHIDNICDGMFPIASAEGGNYVLLNLDKEGEVLFWDHEDPDDLVVISPNFEAFLSMLTPFDVNSIKLKPGQVKKAWIDPDFLKKLN